MTRVLTSCCHLAVYYSIDAPFVMAGEDTVVPVTTSSGYYSERRIDHATDLCESTSAVPSHSQPHQPRSFAFPKRSFGKKTIAWRAFQAKRFDSYSWLHYDQ